MSRPSLILLARALIADPHLGGPDGLSRAAARVTMLCARVYGWHAAGCPRRHLHAALVAEVSDLPGLTDAQRRAALEVIAAHFCPTDSDMTDTPEKETP